MAHDGGGDARTQSGNQGLPSRSRTRCVGETFKIDDPEAKAHAVKNPWFEPKPGVLQNANMAARSPDRAGDGHRRLRGGDARPEPSACPECRRRSGGSAEGMDGQRAAGCLGRPLGDFGSQSGTRGGLHLLCRRLRPAAVEMASGTLCPAPIVTPPASSPLAARWRRDDQLTRAYLRRPYDSYRCVPARSPSPNRAFDLTVRLINFGAPLLVPDETATVLQLFPRNRSSGCDVQS
jgi:hypothetical protein